METKKTELGFNTKTGERYLAVEAMATGTVGVFEDDPLGLLLLDNENNDAELDIMARDIDSEEC